MTIYFIANNIHFTLGLVSSLVFFVMFWLSADAYFISRHYSSAMRVVGLLLVAIWQLINAFSFGGDIVNLFGSSLYIVGLILIVGSFISTPRMSSVSAVILLPAFSSVLPSLSIISGILLLGISYLAYDQMKREYNKSLQPFFIGFLLLAISSFAQVFNLDQGVENYIWYVTNFIDILAYISLSYWFWQYLKMRIRESLMLIFISMTIFMSTVVTLAFSTILISKIEQETRANLLINAKSFDFVTDGLMEESSAKSKLIASDSKISNAIAENNSARLEEYSTKYLSEEHLGFLVILDKNGVVLMRGQSPNEIGDSLSGERAVEEALLGKSFTTIEFSPSEKFSIRSSSPIYRDGRVVGVVIAGFPLDNTMVDRIKKITGLDATFYQDNKSVATTAFADDGKSRLIGDSISDKNIVDNVLRAGRNITDRVVIKNKAFLASYIPLVNGDNKIVGMLSVSKPQADLMDIADATNRLTLITVTLILLVLAFPILMLTRKLMDSI